MRPLNAERSPEILRGGDKRMSWWNGVSRHILRRISPSRQMVGVSPPDSLGRSATAPGAVIKTCHQRFYDASSTSSLLSTLPYRWLGGLWEMSPGNVHRVNRPCGHSRDEHQDVITVRDHHTCGTNTRA